MILSENKTSYFKSYYSIPTQVQTSTIDDYEREAMRILLGSYAYDEFSTDLQNGLPVSQKWIDFVNGINYLNDNNLRVKYDGIIELLQAYVAYKINSDYSFMTGVGRTKPTPENGNKISPLFNQYENNKRYNLFCKKYNEAVNFLLNQNYKINNVATSIIDNTDGTYTVNADTYLINVNSQVKFTNNYYNVIQVEPTFFVIEAEIGKTFDLNFEFNKYNRLLTGAISVKKIVNYG